MKLKLTQMLLALSLLTGSSLALANTDQGLGITFQGPPITGGTNYKAKVTKDGVVHHSCFIRSNGLSIPIIMPDGSLDYFTTVGVHTLTIEQCMSAGCATTGTPQTFKINIERDGVGPYVVTPGTTTVTYVDSVEACTP